VQRILAGKLLNAGQTCIAPDYVLLPRAQLQAFVDAAREQARRGYPAGLADANFCSVVNDRHYRRLCGLGGRSGRQRARRAPVRWRRARRWQATAWRPRC
jgi:coniferyl-aldehyde dehydrogenase